jgi:diguanylate cyclase (GGDEF)-like protein
MQLRPADGGTEPLKGLVIAEEGGHVLFLRPPGTDGDPVMEEMATLNQQLNDMNRKLQKERRRLREANERIERMARTDTLTGLANRRVHDDEMDRAVSAARRHDEPLSVLMADLDKFKNVNDEYGHAAGDRVLKAFGKLLQESCRAEDVPLRFGGEEFLVIMPHTDADEARRMAERLREEWAQTDVSGVDRPTTVSIGVAEWQRDEDQEELVRRADDALYAAKDDGRNCVRSAGPT